jgi:hypothetical protein
VHRSHVLLACRKFWFSPLATSHYFAMVQPWKDLARTERGRPQTVAALAIKNENDIRRGASGLSTPDPPSQASRPMAI